YALGPRKRRDGGILRLRQPVSCATQAEPPIVLGRQAAKPTAEFAGIVGRMHGAPAQQAASSPHLVGEVLITRKQQIGRWRHPTELNTRKPPSSSKALTRMAKPGRNDPCHCSSGKKYKKCCQPKEEAAEHERLAKEQLGREEARRLEQRRAREE